MTDIETADALHLAGDVDAVDAIVAALALPRQVVGDVGADVARTVAAVGGAQHADRHAAAVVAVLVRRALLLVLLRTDLDTAAAGDAPAISSRTAGSGPTMPLSDI